MYTKSFLKVLVIAFVFAFTFAVPRSFNYQGKLVDSAGVGLNDTLSITFRLYTSETGGEPIWEETFPNVIIQQGLFNVRLSDFPPSMDFSSAYWIELEVNGEALSPRERLSATPYAIRSEYTEQALQSVSSSARTVGRRGHIRYVPIGASSITESEIGDTIYIAIGGARTPAEGFEISVNQSSVSVYRGSTARNEVSIILLAPGESMDISLSAMGLPAGATATFSPSHCTPSCPSTMTITTTDSTPPGTYTVKVIGTSASVARTATFTLTVNVPFNYTIVVDPDSSTIDQGSQTSTVVSANLITGFPENVTFSVSGLPSGCMATFSPTSCILSCSSTLTISTSVTTPPGTYPCLITAMTTSGVVRTTTFTLTVRYFNFTLSLSQSSGTIDQGGSISTTVTATRVSEVSQTLNFSLLPGPMYAGITATLTTTSCTPTCNTTLNITASQTVPPGNYPIDIVATGVGGSTDTIRYNLTVNYFNFTLAISPTSGTIKSSGDTVYTDITATLVSPVTQRVLFSYSTLPAGISASFSADSCNPTCNSRLTFTSSGASIGNYSIDITGTAIGGRTRTQTYTLTVCNPPGAPRNLTATGGIAQVVLNWEAPSSNGGCAITNYRIYRSTSPNPTTLLRTVGNVLTYTDSSVTVGTTYYYRVTAVNAEGEGGYSNEASAAAIQVNVTFTNCGQTGSTGPSQAQCDAAYAGTPLAGQVTVVNGIQQWTVPVTATYRITAAGAAGGTQRYGGGYAGGRGAIIRGDFNLTAGTVLKILVGQKGEDTRVSSEDNAAPGGGGGTFVYINPTDTYPLIAAGGGGSGARCSSVSGTNDASFGINGNRSGSVDNGGQNGNGGRSNAGGSSYWAGGGAGWLTDGTGGNNSTNYSYTPGSQGAYGGRSPRNGGVGGTRWNDGIDEGGDGGFGGGGGGGSDNMGGGGGGGYSGGGGARYDPCGNEPGGGGGSYNGGSNPTNVGYNTGHGYVTIQSIAP